MNEEFPYYTRIFEKIKDFSNFVNSKSIIESADDNQLTFLSQADKLMSNRSKYLLVNISDYDELAEFTDYVDDATINLKNGVNEKNGSYYDEAITLLLKAIPLLQKLPYVLLDSSLDFASIVNDFERNSRNKLNRLEKEFNMRQNNLETYDKRFEKKENELNSLEKKINEKEARIKNLDEKFRNDISIQMDNLKADSESRLEELKKNFEDFSTFSYHKADLIISDLTSKLEEGKKLVNLIGNVTVTGNYQRIASEHKKDANLWRWIAAFFMLIFAILLVCTIIDINSKDFDFIKSIVRIIAALALTYPATYAARESSKHRRLETINRQAELELTSINPFIEFLPIETQNKIKEELVVKYFNGNFEKNNSFDKNLDEEVSISAFERIIKAISEIKGK